MDEKMEQVLDALEDMYTDYAYVAKTKDESYDTPQGKCNYKVPIAWHDGGMSGLEHAESVLVAFGRLELDKDNPEMHWYKLTKKVVK